jgi:REP element-mobilizing transposase RayT
MAYFGENWDDNVFPLAYLITIRTFGTWLHGDERSSIDTHDGFNRYQGVRRPSNSKLEQRMRSYMKTPAIVLNSSQRIAVQSAIEEVCTNRSYVLKAINVRTNHAHAVVSAEVKPEKIANAFKSFATRELRDRKLFDREISPWARGRSRRYLWKSQHVVAAIDYVLYCQRPVTFEEWYEMNYGD